jgi:hypothetical protein
VSDEDQRRRYEQLKADQQRVNRAAAQLRHLAIIDDYAGLRHKASAFALALVLDEIGRHLGDLDADLRQRLVDLCEQLT